MRLPVLARFVAVALCAACAGVGHASELRLASLPAVHAKSLAPDAGEGVLRIGVARTVSAQAAREALQALAWEPGAPGGWRATLSVHVEGAAGLRVALARLPQGATVTFRGGGRAWSASAHEVLRAREAHGAYWGPVIEGPVQALEFSSPSRPAGGELALAGISQLLVTPAELRAKAAQACHEDVACVRDADPAFVRAARSVAKLVYTREGATFACTGTLVAADGIANPAPLLLTARHCVGSAEAAASLNTYWFLEADGCGSKTHRAPVQLAGGARLLHAGTSSDIALLQLREPPPAGAEFARIDASRPLAHEPVVAIHHPRGEPKKVSSGLVAEPEEGVDGRLMSVAWLSGTTEPGSSGSGLFAHRSGEWRLRGTLRGGSASCGSTGSPDDPANRDYYTRLDLEHQALRGFLEAPALPAEDFTDMWEGGEPGEGLSVVQHASGNLFAVWFTYDAAGAPTWRVVPGGRWRDPRRFEGEAYHASREGGALRLRSAGHASITFGTDGARLDLDGAEGARAVALRRQSY